MEIEESDTYDTKWVYYPPGVGVTTDWRFSTTTGNPPASPTKANFDFQISDVQILDERSANQNAFAQAGFEKQPDLLYIRFKLMHEGGNKNQDFFDKEELKAAAESPKLKHLNWEHGEPTIGAIYHAEFVDPQDSAAKGAIDTKAHIIAEAVVWKFRYPEIAKKMVKRHASETLAFSMEAYFTEAECSKCGAVFAAEDHPEGTYCEHLNKRFDSSSSASGEKVFRKLKKFILGGAGVVEDPADIDAESLAIARNKEVRQLDKLELTQAELDALIKEAVKAEIEKRNEEAADNETVEKLAAAEASLQEKSDALVDASKTIEKLTAERDEAQNKLKEVEDQVAYDAKATERQTVLEDAGYVAPEDEDEAKNSFATIMNMDDDVFNLFVTTVKAGTKTESKGKPAKSVASRVRVPAAGGVSKEKDADGSVATEAAAILVRL